MHDLLGYGLAMESLARSRSPKGRRRQTGGKETGDTNGATARPFGRQREIVKSVDRGERASSARDRSYDALLRSTCGKRMSP
jgi:hypothetical protein